MKLNLKEFLNKKVMVKLFSGTIQTGVILRSPDEGLFRFQYSTTESKSDDSYSGYFEETVLLYRDYTVDGLYVFNGRFSSPDSLNIVDIQLTEEPVTDSVATTKDELQYWLDNPTKLPEPEVSELRQKLFDAIESVFYNSDYNKVHWRYKVNIAVDEILTIIEDT